MRTTHALLLTTCLLLTACTAQTAAPPAATPAQAEAAAAPTPQMVSAASAERAALPAVALDPQRGAAIGTTFEAFLSPHQEPAEEQDTPANTPEQFRSTAPSLLRSERQSRGHGIVRFSNDLSRAYVDLQIEGVKAEDIVLFHIHCGQPDSLGPIIADFGLLGSLPEQFVEGRFSAEITNELIERTAESGDGMSGMAGMVGAFTMGCPTPPSFSLMENLAPADVKTVASMEFIARKGELYFNLHTKGQTFYGDIRGQLFQVDAP
jgi:CHRD domain